MISMACSCRSPFSAEHPDNLRVLELYSGIGGMHFALNGALERLQTDGGAPRTVGNESANIKVRAVDISPAAARVYARNFPKTPVQPMDIRALRTEDFENLWMLTMSPPCQPFSRNGKFLDVDDDRCESFLFVLDQLSRVNRPPSFVVMENVKGFEISTAHTQLVQVLTSRNYHIKEFLLNPVDFGFPNSRLRYYLTAAHCSSPDTCDNMSGCRTAVPTSQERLEQSIEEMNPYRQSNADSLDSYFSSRLDEQTLCEVERSCLIPIATLAQHIAVMDIKHPQSTTTNCFTAGYGRYLKGTGSVFCPFPKEKFDDLMRNVIDSCADELKKLALTDMKLRFFSPAEIACLMGFPKGFVIPEDLSNRQAWKLLGNSLNVHIVSLLMYLLLTSE